MDRGTRSGAGHPQPHPSSASSSSRQPLNTEAGVPTSQQFNDGYQHQHAMALAYAAAGGGGGIADDDDDNAFTEGVQGQGQHDQQQQQPQQQQQQQGPRIEVDEAAAHAELRAAISRDGLRLEISESGGRLSALYEVGKSIGKGKFSTVYKALRRSDGVAVALKQVALFDIADARSREKCLKEIRLVQSLDHPHIIRYLDGFFESKQLVLVFEYAEAGDLKRQLRKAREREARFDERVIWKYFSQIAEAVEHMHARRILHRDLKPANIFLTLNGTVKVGDLGLGRLLSERTLEAHSKVGTPLYMSPEVLKGKGYEWSSDVWSLGCILYELAMLRSPFKEEGLNLYGLFQKITAGVYSPISDVYSQELRDLVDAMLRQDPAARPDMGEVVRVAAAMRDATAQAREAARVAAAAAGGGGDGGAEVEGQGGASPRASEAVEVVTPLPPAAAATAVHSLPPSAYEPVVAPSQQPQAPQPQALQPMTELNYRPSQQQQQQQMQQPISPAPAPMPVVTRVASAAANATGAAATGNGGGGGAMEGKMERLAPSSSPPSSVAGKEGFTANPTPSPLDATAAQLYRIGNAQDLADLIESAPAEASASLHDRLVLLGFTKDVEELSDALQDPATRKAFNRSWFALPAAGGGFNQFRLFVAVARWLGLRAAPLAGGRNNVAAAVAALEEAWAEHRTGSAAPFATASALLQIASAGIPGIAPHVAGVTPVSLTSGYGVGVLKLLLGLAEGALAASGFVPGARPKVIASGMGSDGEADFDGAEQVDTDVEEDDELAMIKGRLLEEEQDREEVEGGGGGGIGSALNDPLLREATPARKTASEGKEASIEDEGDGIALPHASGSASASGPPAHLWAKEYEGLKGRLALFDKKLAAGDAPGVAMSSAIGASSGGGVFSSSSNWRSHVAVMLRHTASLGGGGEGAEQVGEQEKGKEKVVPYSAVLDGLSNVASEAAETVERVRIAEGRWNKSSSSGNTSGGGGSGDGVAGLVLQYRQQHEMRMKLAVDVEERQQSLLKSCSLLGDINTQCDAVGEALEVRGAAMSSTSKIQAARGALITLQKEKEAMEVQIGILRHSLLRKQYAEAAATREDVREGREAMRVAEMKLCPPDEFRHSAEI